MKKLIFLIPIIVLFSGCSFKSYSKTTIYKDKTKIQRASSISILKSNTSNNCNEYSYYPYCCDDDCCSTPQGMYLQDDVGW